MIKKVIKFQDWDGKDVEKEAWFHLNKAELIDLQMETDGGFDKYLKRITETNDSKELYATFKKIVLMAYGVRDEYGFRKDEKATAAFASSEAFGELIMELLSDADKAAAFINGIIPKMPEDHKAPAVEAK